MINFKDYPAMTKAIIPDGIQITGNSLHDAFNNMKNIKNVKIPNTITNISNTYKKCANLTGIPVCGPNVVNMSWTYQGCTNLTGNPVCGDNVTNMICTYQECTNLTGSPVCGPKVTNMYSTYSNCTNLTGNPVCGDNVTSMGYTYDNCTNLTGNPVCGPRVTSMAYTYYNCTNLTGSPVCGPRVIYMNNTYRNCYNIYGNMYVYSLNIINVSNCFNGRNTSNRLNIYVHNKSKSYNTLMNTHRYYSIVGANISWTSDYTPGKECKYNTQYNIYIYPVSNMAAARVANGE